MSDSSETSERSLKIKSAFQNYRVQLDESHDLQEKLVKKSRDITIESKRIIFLLHRRNATDNEEKTLSDANKRLMDVYRNIIFGIGSLLTPQDIHHYISSYSPGIQEFVEALAFYYYMKYDKIISMEDIFNGEFLFHKNVYDEMTEEKNGHHMSKLLSPVDYLLGLADLTGELMRKCVASGSLEEPFRLRTVLKDIYSAFLLIGNECGREMNRKTTTLKASLHKVDNACYTIRVRGSEFEKLSDGKNLISKEERLVLDDVFANQEMPISMDDSLF